MTNPKQCPTCGSGDPQKAGPPCSLPGNAPDAFHNIPLEVAEWDRDGRLLRRNYDTPASEPSDDEPIPGVPESFWRWLEGDSITRVESDARVAVAFKRGADWADGNPIEDRVAEAELRLGRAWHSMALNTIRNAMTDPDEPEVISSFDTEAREIIRGMVAKGVRDQMEADAKMARRSNND